MTDIEYVAGLLWTLLHNGKEFAGDNETLKYYIRVVEEFTSDSTVKELIRK